MKRTGFFLLLLSLLSVLSAQESFKISKPEATLSNNIFTIKYDITGCKRGVEFVDITLILLNSKGDTIKPGYLSGDVGNKISCGLNKTIEWDLLKDKVELDEDIQIILGGDPSAPVVSDIVTPGLKKSTRGNIILSSVVIPGLGQKKASGKPVYLAFSGLVYGSLGASCYFNFIKSKQLKKDYLAASGTDGDILFSKWEKSYDMTKYFIYGSAGIWAINFIWSAVIPLKDNHLNKMNLSLTSSRQNELLVSAKWKF